MNSASISTRLERLHTSLGEMAFQNLLFFLFSGSFLVHITVVASFIPQPIALDDMFQYDMLARSLQAGNGYRWYTKADIEILRPYYSRFLDIDHLAFPENGLPTTFRAPGYPFFLSLLYMLVPGADRFILARVVQAGLMAALAPLAALLAYQAGGSRKACILAAAGISFYPILLFYPIGLASENLYILLCVISLLLIWRSAKTESWKWVILAGFASGAAMLTRSIFAGFVLLGGIWLGRIHPFKTKAGVVFLLIAFGLCAPWSIRNSILMQKPAFVENSAGYNLFIGYHPEGDGGFISRIAIQPMNILDDGARDRYCMRQAMEYIQQNPMEAARRVIARWIKFIGPEDREFFFFYSNNLIGPVPRPGLVVLYALLALPWASTLAFGIAGLWHTRDRKGVLLILLYLLGYGLPHLLILAEPRFHLAWVPVLVPFAACAWEGKSWLNGKGIFQRGKRLMIAVMLLVLLSFAAGFATNLPKLAAILGKGGNQLYFPY